MKDMFLTDRKLDRRITEVKKYRYPEYPESGGVCGAGRSSGSGESSGARRV